jgi:hypothetical protein
LWHGRCLLTFQRHILPASMFMVKEEGEWASSELYYNLLALQLQIWGQHILMKCQKLQQTAWQSIPDGSTLIIYQYFLLTFFISPQISKNECYLVCEHIIRDSISWLVCYVIVMCGATAIIHNWLASKIFVWLGKWANIYWHLLKTFGISEADSIAS